MEGIIYKTQPYKEHARLLFVYGPMGKKTLIAQGSQKTNNPQRVLAQYLTKIKFKDTERSMSVLMDAVILDDYQTIKNDYDQTKHAALILEIIDQCVTDQQIHPAIYHEITMALSESPLDLIALSFAVKMLKPLGYQMNLTPDGRKIKGIDVETGGLIYEDDNISVDLDAKTSVDLLRLTLMPYAELKTLAIASLGQIRSFVSRYYQYHLQTTLKNIQ